MRDFNFLVEDRRYAVPTLHLVPLKDADQAREIAAGMLAASRDHLGVEVWEGDTLLFTLDSPGRSAPPSPATAARNR